MQVNLSCKVLSMQGSQDKIWIKSYKKILMVPLVKLTSLKKQASIHYIQGIKF